MPLTFDPVGPWAKDDEVTGSNGATYIADGPYALKLKCPPDVDTVDGYSVAAKADGVTDVDIDGNLILVDTKVIRFWDENGDQLASCPVADTTLKAFPGTLDSQGFNRNTCFTEIHENDDGILTGSPDHDVFAESASITWNPDDFTIESVDVGGAMQEIFRIPLPSHTQQFDCRRASLRVDYTMSNTSVCVPDGSAVFFEYFISDASTALASGDKRLTSAAYRNRNFDSCYQGQKIQATIPGASIPLIAGGIGCGEAIDLGELVFKIDYIGFQSQTVSPAEYLSNIFGSLTIRCTWTTEKEPC